MLALPTDEPAEASGQAEAPAAQGQNSAGETRDPAPAG